MVWSGKGYLGRERRVAVSLWATLIEADGCSVEVEVLDVSSSGFRIASSAELEVGDEVQLKLARSAPLRAEIMWTRGRECGGTFLDPVEPLS